MTASRSLELVGPFTHHAVVVDGYEVPHLTGEPVNGGEVVLTLDGRLSLQLPVALFDGVTLFIADAIAVASGYASHPSDPTGSIAATPYRRLRRLD